MGCDRCILDGELMILKFQSTHPHGVRPRPIMPCRKRAGFQSTHPHGVRQGAILGVDADEIISIHAPAWGATEMYRRYDTYAKIFQSTHPHGVRPILSASFIVKGDISIHAPAWGATSMTALTRLNMWNFNPRTRMGCDASNAIIGRHSSDFNPRTRMGCDAFIFT